MEKLDKELERISRVLALCESIKNIMAEITDQEEYKRFREYTNSRFPQTIDMPYTSPFIKEKIKENN